jgi:metallophosphoesterase (TIGR00282 family)
MRILLVGDVVGQAGRKALARILPNLRKQEDINFVVVNGENAAGGFGLTEETADEILAAGADIITSGNHIWDKREIYAALDAEDIPIIRPANYPDRAPGKGIMRIGEVVVINLQGRVFMPEGLDSPFETARQLLDDLEPDPPEIILVDFHTEATSEQSAMGWFLDGRVTAVVGTHTHVPTADTRILPKGTAYVTDLGMTGPVNSIIGSRVEDVLSRFLTAMPRRLNVVEDGPVQFNSVLIETDDLTNKPLRITRRDEVIDQ